MSIFFSPSTAGFYFEADKALYQEAGTWPSDLLEIEEASYQQLMSKCAAGMSISAGEDGSPVAHVTPKTPADVAALNERERDLRLEEATLRIAPLQDAVDLGVATESETSSLLAWRAYRLAVNRIDLSLEDPAWPTRPEQ